MTRVGVNALFLGTTTRSGTATYTWSLVRELLSHDDVDLVIYTQGGVLPDDPDIRSGATIVACPTFRSLVARVGWEQTQLQRKAASDGVDVLWSPGYVTPLVGKLPTVVTVHDLYYVKSPEVLSTLRRLYYRTMVPRSARKAAAVIAVSDSTRRDLAEHVPASRGKTTVIHQGVRPGLGETPVIPEDPGEYVLMVASVTANKNVGRVIEAIDTKRRGGDDLRLVVVGADPFGLLEEARGEHDTTNGVTLVTDATDAELAGWYRGAVAYVHASTYEGFGLPVLEAQALGAPVVSSSAGPLPEVAGEGAVYFDHTSTADLIRALDEVRTDEMLRSGIIAAGAANVTRFDWARAATATAEVLRDAAGVT